MLNMRMVEESMKVMSATGRFRVHMSMAVKKKVSQREPVVHNLGI